MRKGKGQGARGKKKYRALVVGAGNIGAFFDRPSDKNVLTHAHAYKSHPGFELAGFVDADRKKAARAAKVWGGRAFLSIEEAFASGPIDVVSVAVPDALHYPVLKSLAGYPVKLVFAEKPLAASARQGREICALYKKKGIGLAVNYTRRFVPGFEAMKRDIAAGRYGRFVTGTGYYGKGLFHNGSHMVDLVRSLLGEVSSPRVLSKINDFYKDDTSVSAAIAVRGGMFNMLSVPAGSYTIFELDLLFTKKRVRITDSGFRTERYDVKVSPVFKGYRNLVLSAFASTRMCEAMYAAAGNIHLHLAKGERLKSSGNDALGTLMACEMIKRGKG